MYATLSYRNYRAYTTLGSLTLLAMVGLLFIFDSVIKRCEYEETAIVVYYVYSYYFVFF